MSEEGPGVTIIDCEGSAGDPHRGFYFHSGEHSTWVLHGFTIRNGYWYLTNWDRYGGGIFCSGSSPIIEGNVITGNTANVGGGIAGRYASSPTIRGNTITGNHADFRGGGGIYWYFYC
ncbi:hypothetical protein AMJ39_05305 [candidate division TA06 bacterium DG_24]|uniref:Right handed beta helix domain-containing protein n=1 Tax=candidate division TA06 bacterium DG_24 TaxID=1703770 RepID=A0A0S7WST5_UNCT6|nr:MAG: hypothetical protein AMJ39_05305 [candidate division TA06 bacterium DG_24]